MTFKVAYTDEYKQYVKDCLARGAQPIEAMPTRGTSGSSGLDLVNVGKGVAIKPWETAVVKTGIKASVPIGKEIQVRPRSGLFFKKKLLSFFGTVDSDYRGEIGVAITNMSNITQCVNHGERVAQIILANVDMTEPVLVNDLDDTERGTKGFGSTGHMAARKK